MKVRKSKKAPPNNISTHYRTFNTNDKVSFIVAVAVLLILIGVPAFYLGKRSNEIRMKFYPNNKKVAITPTGRPMIPSSWKKYDGTIYSVKYPDDWTAKEEHDDYFGDQIIVSNPSGSVVFRVLTGTQPFGFGGPQDIKSNDMSVTIEGKRYDIKEAVVNNRQAYVDHTFKKGDKEYQLLFGTGYPVGADDLASLLDYTKSKATLIKILSTLSIK
ncbi:MAG: hypothetical protein Q7S61_03575 [bacterium]|nr:hypothetical protein [bacterium]